jgi:hypothetical protein
MRKVAWQLRSHTELDERRLGERILIAFDRALEQDDLEVAGQLHKALELVMLRPIPGEIERRSPPVALLAAFARLERLRETLNKRSV